MLWKKLGIPAVAIAAACSFAFVDAPQDPKPLPKPTVTFRGEFSKIDELRYVKVTDAETWARLWCEHTGADQPRRGYVWHYNEDHVPIVDFEQCMVVAVFGGKTGNRAGYYVREVLDGEQLTLRFDDLSYQTTIIDPDNAEKREPSKPFGMFVLPKTDRKVALVENVQGMINQPPKWQLKATL